MDRFKFLSVFLVLFAILSGCAHPTKSIPRDIASLNANGGMVGVWFLQGTSSTRGPYNGEFELGQGSDGTFDVIRVVTYINYFYEGLRVQEVWQGKAVADTDTLTVTYDLNQGDFITKIDGLTKSAQEMRTPVTINLRFFPSPTGLTAKFSDKRTTEYSEWLTTQRTLDAAPLWKADRVLISAQSAPVPTKEKQNIKAAQKILNFGKDPFVQSFKNQADFKSEHPRIIVDKSDFDFYKNNTDVIRLINKVTDDATIAESVLKRNAYFPSLKEKATRYDDLTATRNFSSSNLVVVRKGDSEQSLSPDTSDIDAGFATGMYLASQAMRFQATKNEQALINMRRALRGLRTLAEISKGTKNFASAVTTILPEQKIPDDWTQGQETFQAFMWYPGNQENTMLGVLHGLTWAVQSIPPADEESWNHIREILKSVSYKDQTFSNLSASARSTLGGLTLLVFEDSAGRVNFENAHPPKASFYFAGNADWKMEFENLIEAMNQIQLGQALNDAAKVSEWKNYLLAEYRIFAAARRPIRTFATAYFISGTSQELLSAVTASAQVLTEVPYPRARTSITIDHAHDSSWILSPIPRNYWSVKEKTRQPVQTYYQGLRQLPVFELSGYTSRFTWKDDAFQYNGQSPKDIEATGVDYLYGYWLARLAGVSDAQ